MSTTLNESYTQVSDGYQAVKASLTIYEVWNKLGLEGEPKRKCKSPFREENNESFSIYDDGRRWKDFGTDEGGDVFDFYEKATGKCRFDAITELKEWCRVRTEKMAMRVKQMPKQRLIQTITFDPPLTNNLGKLDREGVSFLRRKGIRQDTFDILIEEGSLAIKDGKLAFVYPTGIKVRKEWESSRSNRWIQGSAGEDSCWRFTEIMRPEVNAVLITEGETDLMRVLSVSEVPSHWAVIAAPSASWRPSGVLLHTIGYGRTVVIAFDHDDAGLDGAARLVNSFWDVPGCDPWYFPWGQIMPPSGDMGKVKDLCDLETSILQATLDRVWSVA